jgi:hypothetical protein
MEAPVIYGAILSVIIVLLAFYTSKNNAQKHNPVLVPFAPWGCNA